jgi:hypothetical protein
MDFSSLQHIRAKRVHFTRALPPPATFRLQGLATLLTAYSPRRRVGPVSCRQRSWDSPFEAFPSDAVPRRFRRREPTCRSSCRFTRSPEGDGPARQAATSGSMPRPSPWLQAAGLTRPGNWRLPWASALPGETSDSLAPGVSARRSSHALRPATANGHSTCATESQSALA